MFGLAALAALMAMAFAGASSAMAEDTALCKLDPGTGADETCPANKLVTHVHYVTLPGQKEKILTEYKDIIIECDDLFLGDVLRPYLGSPLVIHGKLTTSNCNNFCTITEENGPGTLEFLKLGHELADVTLEFLKHLQCPPLFNCWYTTEYLVAHALGPLLSDEDNGDIVLHDQEMQKEKGGICPMIMSLDFLITPLQSHLELLMKEGVFITL
jgi:hypothetical protein